MEDDWLTVAEAAKHLKVHRTTLYRMIDDGRVPYHVLPGSSHKRFKRSELDAILQPGRPDQEKTE